ncbi:hypothetical protein C5E05_16530 [Pseudoclavibacter sp. AY1H1]|nr:hypothetical protein C5E05_16530 [Pseudoclavibacter sp. AY1H1]
MPPGRRTVVAPLTDLFAMRLGAPEVTSTIVAPETVLPSKLTRDPVAVTSPDAVFTTAVPAWPRTLISPPMELRCSSPRVASRNCSPPTVLMSTRPLIPATSTSALTPSTSTSTPAGTSTLTTTFGWFQMVFAEVCTSVQDSCGWSMRSWSPSMAILRSRPVMPDTSMRVLGSSCASTLMAPPASLARTLRTVCTSMTRGPSTIHCSIATAAPRERVLDARRASRPTTASHVISRVWGFACARDSLSWLLACGILGAPSAAPGGCVAREQDIITQELSWVSVLLTLVVGAGLAFIAVRRTRNEPRRLSNGVWIVAAAVVLISAVSSFDGQVSMLVSTLTWLPFVLSPALLLALIVLLYVNGARMIRREGRSLGNLLSLVLAVILTALAALPFAAILVGDDVFISIALLLAAGAAYLGAAFALFLAYSWLYSRLVRGAVGTWVVVLGSGLSGGRRVPPLLAARIRAGLDAAHRVGASVVVMSGGQGGDEALAEGRAMREWALDPANADSANAGTDGRQGAVRMAGNAAEPRILSEEESVNTEENLRFTTRILEREGVTGPGIIATSNYHAMRAAMLARELGIDAQAVQAPVARYYWPSAILREFAAILRRYWLLNLVAGVLFAFPIPALSLWVALGNG